MLICSPGLGLSSCGPGGGRALQPQSGRLKPPGPAPGDSGVHPQADGLPSRPRGRAARDFSADAAQDAVILSVQDLAAAQEAVDLDRQDQEHERRSWGEAAAGDRPDQGAGSAGRGTPGPPAPPAAPPGGPPADRSAPQSPPAGGPARRGPGSRRAWWPGPSQPRARWPAAPGCTPSALERGAAHDRTVVGAAPPASSLARPGPVARAHPARRGRGAVRRGRDQHRADQQPGPGRACPRRRYPGGGWPGAYSRRHRRGRGGPHGRGTLDRRPGFRGRDRVVRPADVRAAAGPRDPGRAAAHAGREQSRPAGQRSDRLHGGRAQRVRRPAEQRVRASRAGQLRDGQCADRGPGGGGGRRRSLPAQPQDRRGRAGLSRLPAAAEPPAAFLGLRPAGPWPPARSIPGC